MIDRVQVRVYFTAEENKRVDDAMVDEAIDMAKRWGEEGDARFVARIIRVALKKIPEGR
jgi:hypothetical protein